MIVLSTALVAVTTSIIVAQGENLIGQSSFALKDALKYRFFSDAFSSG